MGIYKNPAAMTDDERLSYLPSNLQKMVKNLSYLDQIKWVSNNFDLIEHYVAEAQGRLEEHDATMEEALEYNRRHANYF